MEHQGMRVEDFFYAIKKRLSLIIIITVIATLAGALAFKPKAQEDSYVGATKIYLLKDNVETLDNNEVAVNPTLINTYIESLKSKSFINNVIKEAGIDITTKELNDNLKISLVNDTQILKVTLNGSAKEEIGTLLKTFNNEAVKQVKQIIPNTKAEILDEISTAKISANNSGYAKRVVFVAILALMVSVVVAFLLEYLDQTIKDEEEIEGKFKLSAIAALEKEDLNDNSIRKIRTFIKNSKRYHDKKVILISSELQDSTNIVTTLAKAFGKVEKTVLVIDATCSGRKEESISLLGAIKRNDDVSKVTNKVDEKVDFINIGIDEDMDLIESSSVNNVIKQLKQQYDYIFINAKFINNDVMTQMLASKSELMMLLVKARKTKGEEIEKNIEIINNIDGELIGVIIDKRNSKKLRVRKE